MLRMITGLDCTGKSTKVSRASHNFRIEREHDNDFKYYDNLFSSVEHDTVFDRSMIDEIVYAEQYGREPRITIPEILTLLKKYDIIIEIAVPRNTTKHFEAMKTRWILDRTKIDSVSQLGKDRENFIVYGKLINNLMQENVVHFFDVDFDTMKWIPAKDADLEKKSITLKFEAEDRKVIEYDLNGKKLKTYDNLDAVRMYGHDIGKVKSCLTGKIAFSRCVTFRYLGDSLNMFSIYKPQETSGEYAECEECGKLVPVESLVSSRNRVCKTCKYISSKRSEYDEFNQPAMFKDTECNVCHETFNTEVDKRGVPYLKTCPKCKRKLASVNL